MDTTILDNAESHQGKIALAAIDRLTGGRVGTFDTACPFCSAARKRKNQQRKVFRIYRIDEAFAGYHCVHCGEKGFARDGCAAPPDPLKLQRLRTEAQGRERAATTERRDKALSLWSQARPLAGSIGETYLREARGYRGPLPATLRYLPAKGDYLPALIAAFGFSAEPEPGVLAIAPDKIVGVQLTRLAPDGRSKADTDHDKKTVGRFIGAPIGLAPPNDLLGLAIAEGIEDALSVHQSRSLGAWAAGGAGRLPALANAVPDYIECVTVMVDNDQDGEKNAGELERRLALRGIEVILIRLIGQRQ